MLYFDLLRRESHLLSFGILLSFLSGFGQPFFISLYGEQLRDTFGLSNGEFGMIFLLATLGNVFGLSWLGKYIDTINLRIYTALAVLGLGGGCFLVWNATSLFGLVSAVVLLRLCGPGLLVHISNTTTTRYIIEDRAKALAITMMGSSLCNLMFPTMAVSALLIFDWRLSWLVYAATLLFLAIPLLLFLLWEHSKKQSAARKKICEYPPEQRLPGTSKSLGHQWTRHEVLKDIRFYLAVPAFLTPPFVGTAIFFHQAVLVEQKGWTLEWFALMYVPFALAGLVGSLTAAPLIDKLGHLKIMPWALIPFTIGLLALTSTDNPIGAFLFMVISGLSTGGLLLSIQGPLWAKSYGLRHVGSIHALLRSLVFLSAATAPPLIGILLDWGITFNAIALGCAVYSALSATLLAIAAKKYAQPGWAD